MGQRRVELVLAYAAFVVTGLSGGASGVLLPAQIAYYRIDKSVIGLLFVSFSAGFLLSAWAGGWLLRRVGPRGALLAATVAYSALSLGCGLQPPYPVLVVLTVVLGAGHGMLEAALNTHLAAQPRGPVLLNLLHAFYGVGALAGPVLAAAMFAGGLPWGSVYVLVAALMAPLAAGFALRYPRALPEPDAPPEPGAPRGRPEAAFRAALRHPAVLLSGLFLTVYVGLEISVGNWAYSLLTQGRGQGALLAGWLVSGFWLGFTLGRFVLSALAERYGMGPVALAWACLAGTMAAGAGLWLLPGAVPAAVALAVLGAVLGPIYPLTIAVVPDLAPGRLVPTAIGILVGGSVIGGAFLPWLAGTLAQHVGLGSLLPFVLLLGAVLLVTWWGLARRLVTTPAAGPGVPDTRSRD